MQSDSLGQKKGTAFKKFNTILLKGEVYIAVLQENLPKNCLKQRNGSPRKSK